MTNPPNNWEDRVEEALRDAERMWKDLQVANERIRKLKLENEELKTQLDIYKAGGK